MQEHHHEKRDTVEIPINSIKKGFKNPWLIVSIILAIVIVGMLVKDNFIGMSKSDLGTKGLEFFNTQLTQGGGVLDSIKVESGIYVMNVNYDGQVLPVYFTKDGKFIAQGNSLMALTPSDKSDAPVDTSSAKKTTQTSVPKSDKPKVELFIWSYCPYGVQAQTPLAEVASLLKDKADFSIVPYYDGHGAHETEQNKIQSCIQKLDKDKYWNYSTRFVSEIYPKCGSTRDVACDKTESVKLMTSLGIDSAKVLDCVASQGDALFSSSSSLAQSYGVQGSPTLIINGVKASPSSRTAEAFKSTICSAFNNAPAECGTALSNAAAASTGNCG